MQKPLYTPRELEEEKQYVIKKLGITHRHIQPDDGIPPKNLLGLSFVMKGPHIQAGEYSLKNVRHQKKLNGILLSHEECQDISNR